jgi:signal transduction histidine kinase
MPVGTCWMPDPGPTLWSMGKVALVLTGVTGAALVTASVILPRAQDVPVPGVVDVVVPAVLVSCSLLLATRRHRWPAALLAMAGVLWCTVGLAWVMPQPVADGLARLGVLPLALVVAVALTLPLGSPWQARTLLALALGVAVAGGAGWPVPVRLALGLLLLVRAAASMRSRAGPEGPATQAGLLSVTVQAAIGAGLVLSDPMVSGATFPPHLAAGTVGLMMAGTGLAAVRTLDPDRRVWKAAETAATTGDRLGVESWVGDLLGSPGLRISYPDGRGGHLLEDGSRSPAPAGPTVVDPGGEVIAGLSREVAVDAAIRPALVRLLRTVGASARIRASQRERSAELERSRARLAAAAFDERVALERRLAQSVVPLLDAIEERLALLPDADAVRARVDAARAHVLASARGLRPVGGRSLAEALIELVSLAPHLVSVDVSALGDVDSASSPDDAGATALWFSAAEAVSNALKHARTSVTVRALGPCRLQVVDTGPGGADPAGSGLAGIRDRLHAVGGTLELTSDLNGTRVTASVPSRVRADPYTGRGLAATPAPTGATYRR